MTSRRYSIGEVRRFFLDSGTTVTEWAAAHGFQRADVYSLLQGRTRGHRGRSHSVAVALGIKQLTHNPLFPVGFGRPPDGEGACSTNEDKGSEPK
jgi:gp16 family phage-associated protein